MAPSPPTHWRAWCSERALSRASSLLAQAPRVPRTASPPPPATLLALPSDLLILILRCLPFRPLAHLLPRICSRLRALARLAVHRLPDSFPQLQLPRALATWPRLCSVPIDVRSAPAAAALGALQTGEITELLIHAVSSPHFDNCIDQSDASVACRPLANVTGITSLTLTGSLCDTLPLVLRNNASTLTSLRCLSTLSDEMIAEIARLAHLRQLCLRDLPVWGKEWAPLAPLVTELSVAALTCDCDFPRLVTLEVEAEAEVSVAARVVERAPALSRLILRNSGRCAELVARWPHLLVELHDWRAPLTADLEKTFARLEELTDERPVPAADDSDRDSQSVFCDPRMLAASLPCLRRITTTLKCDNDVATDARLPLLHWLPPRLTRLDLSVTSTGPNRWAEVLVVILRRFPWLPEVRLSVHSDVDKAQDRAECDAVERALLNAQSTSLRLLHLAFCVEVSHTLRAGLARMARQTMIWIDMEVCFPRQ